jgi:hypothetical protein
MSHPYFFPHNEVGFYFILDPVFDPNVIVHVYLRNTCIKNAKKILQLKKYEKVLQLKKCQPRADLTPGGPCSGKLAAPERSDGSLQHLGMVAAVHGVLLPSHPCTFQPPVMEPCSGSSQLLQPE